MANTEGAFKKVALALEAQRYYRFTVTMSAAAAYTEVEINTNLNISRDQTTVAMLHSFDYEPDTMLEQPGASGSESFIVQLLKQTQTAEIFLNNPDLLLKQILINNRGAAIGTDAGPFIQSIMMPIHIDIVPFIAVAVDRLFVGIDGTMAGAVTVRGRIGYHLITVTEKEFLRLSAGLIV